MSGRALVLAAHGSRHISQVNERIEAFARQLAGRTGFDTVRAAFHQGVPALAEVLDLIEETEITVVPVMTSRGWYANRVLPRELARNHGYADKRVRMTAPVGTHSEIPALAQRRLEQVCANHGFDKAQTTVVIVGHGTPRHIRSRRATVDLASRLGYAARFGQLFAVFLDDEPGLDAVIERATHESIIVLPFLIGAGPHAVSDIPNRVNVASGGDQRIVCDRPVGEDDGLVDIIADLATGRTGKNKSVAPARRALRLGTRGSALAMWQAEQVANQLRAADHAVDIVELSTLGDRVRDRAIHEIAGDAPFCDDIEFALGAGLIDLGVHSLKDLNLYSSRAFELAAILPRGDAREALVSHENVPLEALPEGAAVGTSSPRRAAQVLALRPDLLVRPIRGPVDDRIRQVRAGAFDAAILAVAGLERLGMAHEAAQIFPIEQFVPAPAQAALAVQIRAGDDIARSVARPLDETATRIATTLELNTLRALDAGGHCVVAAYATVGTTIELAVRLVSPDGVHVRDFVERGTNPGRIQRAVLAEARAVLADWLQEAGV